MFDEKQVKLVLDYLEERKDKNYAAARIQEEIKKTESIGAKTNLIQKFINPKILKGILYGKK